MDRSSHFFGEERINDALPFNSAFSGEFPADNGDAEVAFPTVWCPGVTGVEVRFVYNFNCFGG